VYTTPVENNLLEWHYVIEGSKDTPYEGGFYWGKLIFPKEYPLKPPGVMMLTPNGRFQTGRRLCLSMSDFHPESWNPMWSVSTIITGLISFMVESAPTLGSIDTSTTEKKKFAYHSLDFNVKDDTFRKMFPELVKRHEEIMEERIRTRGLECVTKDKAEVEKMSISHKRARKEELQSIIALVVGLLALFLGWVVLRFP
jgi:ubiquitin-conjugating enzyme E2 J2